VTKRPTQPDDWSSRSEALLRIARDDHAASAADRARVRSALARRLAQTSSVPAIDRGAQTAVLGKSAGSALLGKLTLLAVAVACVVAGTVAIERARDVPPPKAADPSMLEPKPAEPVQEPSAPAHESAAAATKPAFEIPSRALSAAPVQTIPRRSHARMVPAKPATPATAAGAAEPLEAPEPRAAQLQPSAANRTEGAVAAAAVPAKGASASVPPSSSTPVAAMPERPPAQHSAQVAASDEQGDARAELAFMARINAALLAAKPRLVLSLCAEHERRWPHGMFVQERNGLRALAACNSGASSAAELARAYLASYPRAPLALRVRDTCAAQLKAAGAPVP
jgi:hypothetical protein